MVVASLVAILLTKPQQLGHLRRDADDVVIARPAAYLAAQRFDLGAQPRGFQRVLDCDCEFVEIERLADKVVGAQLERSLYVVQLRIGRDHDDGAGVARFLELFENVDAAGIGQAHVEQHEIRRLVVRHAERSRSRCQPPERDIPTLRTFAGETNGPASRRRR